MPQYFLVRFVPWSLLFLGLFLRVDRGEPGAFPWAPVYTWFLLVLVFFSVPTFKRDDYLLPVYPVCAIAAGYATWTLRPRFRVGVIALALALMAGAVAEDFFTKDHLRPRYAGNCAHFAHTVREALPSGSSPLFDQTGYNSLQAFLGTNSPLSESRVDSLREGDCFAAAYLLREDQAIAHRRHGPDCPPTKCFPPFLA